MNYALIFPGQGSQSVGMLQELNTSFSVVSDVFNTASDIVGFDLWQLTQTDKEKLNQTQNTQLIMFCAAISCFKVLTQHNNLSPKAMAGHSLGEISALCASNSLNFTDSIRIIQKRAELMINAVPNNTGAMAAILGLADSDVITLCKNYNDDGVVEAVNFNANGQVVIAGTKNAVDKICQIMKDNGAKKVIVLPVSVPSHSILMLTAGKKFAKFIDDFNFKMPNTKLLHNIDGNQANNIKELKQKLAKQLYNPVLWSLSINNLQVEATIELGPAKVLSNLNRRINKNITSYMVHDNLTLNTTLEFLNEQQSN